MQAGKISEKVHKLCQAFMLHPVVVLKNGRMKIKKIYVGRKKRHGRNTLLPRLIKSFIWIKRCCLLPMQDNE